MAEETRAQEPAETRRETDPDPVPPTLDELNTGKGKASNVMTANEYSRYFNPVAAYLKYQATGA